MNIFKKYINYPVIGVILFAGIVGLSLGILSKNILILILILSVGVPFAALVINSSTRTFAIVLILAFLPLTGILKAISGSRYAPLTFDLAILATVIFYLLEGILKNKIRFGKLDILFISFLALAFLQMFNANVPNLQAGIEGFRKFAYMSLTFYIGRHIIKQNDLKLLFKLVIIVSIPVAMYSIKQFFFMSSLDYKMIDLATAGITTYMMGGYLRPFSTLPGPFHLGLYMVISILLTVQYLIHLKLTLNIKIILLMSLVIQFISLIFTRTKGNWIALIIGVLILLFLNSKNMFTFVIKITSISLFGGVFIFIILNGLSGKGLTVIEDAVYQIMHPSEAPTLLYRFGIWEEVVPAILDKPLTGYGTSSAGEGLSNLYKDTQSINFSSHNLYFKIILEMGIIGILLFFGMIITGVKNGWSILQKDKTLSKDVIITFQSGLAIIIIFLISGLTIPSLDAYPVNYYFWLFLGLLTNRYIYQKPMRLEINNQLNLVPKVNTL